MSRNRAAAIVIHDDKLLVMYRKKEQEYFTFPGGGVEVGETNEQAVVREVSEETSLTVEVQKLVYELHYDNGDIHYFFLCKYLSGVPSVRPGTNEYVDNEQGGNIHIPQWLSLSDLSTTTLYPFEVRDRLTRDLQQGLSDAVILSLKAFK